MNRPHIESSTSVASLEAVFSSRAESIHDELPKLCNAILRVLLYYDIWEYPLTLKELQTFLPLRGVSEAGIGSALAMEGSRIGVVEYGGYYSVRVNVRSVVDRRLARERHAQRMWKAARLSTHIIKRFPFVRAVFISGDLSKNSTGPGSDIDFFVLTEPGRLWISRTLLILFKKLFLLNSKKFFCVNFFASIDNLTQQERNVYVAAEVAHLKAMYNEALFIKFMAANAWIRKFFPNFNQGKLPMRAPDNRESHLQRIFERLLTSLPLDRIDTLLMNKMEQVWAQRYPQHDPSTRMKIFKCTKQESRAYGGDFHDKILTMYDRKLREFHIEE